MSILYPIAGFVAASLAALISMLAMLTLGLVVNEYVVFPLALGVAGVFATLAAGWIAGFLTRDGKRPQLLRAAGAVEVVALLLVVAFTFDTLRTSILGPVFNVALLCAPGLGLAATVAVSYMRAPDGPPGRGRREAAVLLGAVMAAVPLVLVLAWALGLAGA